YLVIPRACLLSCLFFDFFFQAEDGIRDSSVTGVQTCALPISVVMGTAAGAVRVMDRAIMRPASSTRGQILPETSFCTRAAMSSRSEERRVGKGGSARGAQAKGRRKIRRSRDSQDT